MSGAATQLFEALYEDAMGRETITFRNSAGILRTCIRGIGFEGTEFNSLEPQTNATGFTLEFGCLTECSMSVDIPIRLVAPEGRRRALLKVDIELVRASGQKGRGYVRCLTLEEPEFQITTKGRASDFEYGLLWLAQQLPVGFALHACITCGLSDYSPAGNQEFGSMICFRKDKEAYHRVRSKSEVFELMNRVGESMQETYYCPEFEIRPSGRGYRG